MDVSGGAYSLSDIRRWPESRAGNRGSLDGDGSQPLLSHAGAFCERERPHACQCILIYS